ncbi:MAG: DUF1311 domain-containing protein [Porphyrobacter sp.]|nr:DUF1311 domain-containing protein [Porphyrobacter sp.]
MQLEMRVFALALLTVSLGSCGELDTASSKKPIACNSGRAVAAVKRHVLNAAISSDGKVGIVGDLANILRYQAENAPEDFRGNFQSALRDLEQISRSQNLTSEVVALNVSDIVERGQSETDESLCWARVRADLPSAATVPVSGMKEVLSNNYGWGPSALIESVSIELFYTVQGGSRPAVIESDLSSSSAMAVRGLGDLVQAAPVFLRPFEALRQAEEAREKDLAAAKGRVVEVSLSEARLEYSQSEAALNAAWQNLAENNRKALLPQQRQWLRSREAFCDLQGKEYSSDSTESQVIKIRCMAQATIARINSLREY